MAKTDFVTDLNQRERQRYANALRQTGPAIGKLADALEAEDDTSALVEYLVLSLGLNGTMRELGTVLVNTAEVLKATADLDNEEGING